MKNKILSNKKKSHLELVQDVLKVDNLGLEVLAPVLERRGLEHALQLSVSDFM